MKWPKEVPVIEAKDCHKGGMSSEDGERRCVLGWICFMFKRHEVYHEAANVAHEIAKTKSLGMWNDDPRRKYRTIARLINRTTATLGYTEGNPEKPVKGIELPHGVMEAP